MISIRPAKRNDLVRIATIRHGVAENRLLDPARVKDDEVLWYMDEAIFLVSEEPLAGAPPEVQGFICADHKTGSVWALFVDPGAQRNGHGSALLAAALDRLKTLGHRQVVLTTGAGTQAELFYRCRGFVNSGRTGSGEGVWIKHL